MNTCTLAKMQKISEELNELTAKDAKKRTAELEKQGFAIEWSTDRRTGTSAVSRIEHKPTTCYKYGHQGLDTVVLADSIEAECSYCGWRKVFTDDAEFNAFMNAERNKHNAINA